MKRYLAISRYEEIRFVAYTMYYFFLNLITYRDNDLKQQKEANDERRENNTLLNNVTKINQNIIPINIHVAISESCHNVMGLHNVLISSV